MKGKAYYFTHLLIFISIFFVIFFAFFLLSFLLIISATTLFTIGKSFILIYGFLLISVSLIWSIVIYRQYIRHHFHKIDKEVDEIKKTDPAFLRRKEMLNFPIMLPEELLYHIKSNSYGMPIFHWIERYVKHSDEKVTIFLNHLYSAIDEYKDIWLMHNLLTYLQPKILVDRSLYIEVTIQKSVSHQEWSYVFITRDLYDRWYFYLLWWLIWAIGFYWIDSLLFVYNWFIWIIKLIFISPQIDTLFLHNVLLSDVFFSYLHSVWLFINNYAIDFWILLYMLATCGWFLYFSFVVSKNHYSTWYTTFESKYDVITNDIVFAKSICVDEFLFNWIEFTKNIHYPCSLYIDQSNSRIILAIDMSLNNYHQYWRWKTFITHWLYTHISIVLWFLFSSKMKSYNQNTVSEKLISDYTSKFMDFYKKNSFTF